MIKTWSVFVRTFATGNQNDDMNVVGQHAKTYAGIVRGDGMERAVVNAVQKTGQPAPFLLIFEGEVSVGENAAFCPCCGKNLTELPPPHTSFDALAWPRLPMETKLLAMNFYGADKHKCPHCGGFFSGKVETVTRTIFFQAPNENP